MLKIQSFAETCENCWMLPWCSIGASLIGKKIPLTNKEFRSYFRLSPFLVEIVLKKIQIKFLCTPQKLLWALHFLKSKNPSEDGIARLLKTNKNTLRFHVVLVLNKILLSLPDVFIPFWFYFLIFYLNDYLIFSY